MNLLIIRKTKVIIIINVKGAINVNMGNKKVYTKNAQELVFANMVGYDVFAKIV